MKNRNIEIDFVLTWVDSSDLEWQKAKRKYSSSQKGNIDDSEARFRNWGLLKYWFRSIELNAPWVRKIHFVTFGHIPAWLDINNPKINIVRHEDIMDKKNLPTFNSCAIEMNLHKIPGLSEYFVYFNDDTYLNKPVSQEVFFKNGRPRATYALTKLSREDQANMIRRNCNELVGKYGNLFPNSLNIKNGWLMVLHNFLYSMRRPIGFCSKHAPISYLKDTYVKVWEKEKKNLEQVLSHKFRTDDDYSQWLFEYYQLYTKLSLPRHYSISKYYELATNYDELIKDIMESKHTMICANDTMFDIDDDIEAIKLKIQKTFKYKYPEPSCFEISEVEVGNEK